MGYNKHDRRVTMQDHKQLITQFYQSFQKRDHQGMANCYHADAFFCDEAFRLEGKEINAMWHMLCERAKDFTLTFDINESQGRLQVVWQANYLFSQTNRPVKNIITASFEFKEGKIYRHKDEFNFWRWSSQALGMPGYLLGWSPLLRNKVSVMARRNLNKFIELHEEYKK